MCYSALEENIQERELYVYNNLKKLRKNIHGHKFLMNMIIFKSKI